VHLSDLVKVSANVSATTSRLEKVAAIARFAQRLAPDEIADAVHYLSGQLPQGRVGVGGALLGAMRTVPPSGAAALTVRDVRTAIDSLVGIGGAGANAERQRRLQALFARAAAEEQAFLLRLLSGELRQGAQEGVMLDALAHAAAVPAAAVRRAAMVAGDLGTVAQALLTQGSAALTQFGLQLMQPVAPMLAQSAADVADALRQLNGVAAFEYKLDGARVQLHKAGEEVRVYTRRLNDVTVALPELVELAQRLPAARLVLEGEAIALAADGRPRPFQVTMRRFGRKQDVPALRSALPLSVFFFDCLHHEGRDLIGEPAEERFRVLGEAVPAALLIPRRVTADPAEARTFLAQALARGHEGLLAKALDAPYQAGRRGSAWLKIKSAQTLDLVVLAAEWGNGRRRGWLSNLHLGARDPASGEFVMLGKTFKGMTDSTLAWQTKQLQQLALHRDGGTVYVRPALVVEVAFNNIQASTQYPGGVALRFARIKRYRDDKRPEEVDTIDTVRALHRRERGGAAE
jgi:DNA ligase 1